jgi:outer membrane lipase/esterase
LIGLYANVVSGPLQGAMTLSYGWYDIDSSRRIVFRNIDRSTSSHLNATTFGLSSAFKYAMPAGKITIAPLVTLDINKVSVDGGTESGANALDLTLSKASFTSARIGLGAELGFGDAAAVLHGFVRGAYEHEIGDNLPSQLARHAGSPSTFPRVCTRHA